MKFPHITAVILQCLVLRQSSSTPVSFKTYSCPSNIQSTSTHLVFEKVCYEFVTEKKDHWSDARTDCTYRGGDLVMVSNHDIQYFVYTTLQKLNVGHHDFWIGLHDINQEGHFFWVDGSPLGYSNWGHHEGFGSYHAKDDCIKMDMGDDGLWHDVNCHLVRHPYICQFSAVETLHTAQPPQSTTKKAISVSTPMFKVPTTASSIVKLEYSSTSTPNHEYSSKPLTNYAYPSTSSPNREYPSTSSPNREYPSTSTPNPDYPSTSIRNPTRTEAVVRSSCPDYVCNLHCYPVLYSVDCQSCMCKLG